MTPELTVLALAALLQVIQLGLFAVPANLELGVRKTLSTRDPDRLGKPLIEQVSRPTGRLFRAYNNHFESLALFTIAVVVVTLSEQSNTTTVASAWTYLAARIVYVPAYYFGLSPWRSLFYFVGLIAILVMLLGVFI
ncbi:MAG: MAPEG family protein [Pseudomonadota bacterium]